MKGIMREIRSDNALSDRLRDEDDQLRRQVAALYALLANIYGTDKLVLKAGKLEALNLMRSDVLEERVLALQRLVFEDPTIDEIPSHKDLPAAMNEIEEEIADLIARRTVEEKIERKTAERMQQRHEEYVRDVKAQVLKDLSGPENPQTLKRYVEIEALEEKHLARSVIETIRPASVQEVVGQDRAVKALLSKIASPFPQHVILYGPPGVGKTTVARLALEAARCLQFTPFKENAPFVEVDGSTIRWDPREVTNPLLGSVHDPIYQGARRDLAEGGVPEPKLGLVTEAHGGVLFIDEIGELDPLLQNKLLKVLEDKRVQFDSSYYDPADPNVPKYIKHLFEKGAPADFVLIAATTADPSEINPALRSRCAEVFFEPLTTSHIEEIVRNAAAKLKVDLDPQVISIISEYTIEGRKAVGILADAFGTALFRLTGGVDGVETLGQDQAPVHITEDDVREVIQASRLSPYVAVKASDTFEVGKIFGLGVSGFLGSVLEIEAVAFPARDSGKGSIRFNDTAGSMAKDSVFNAASVVRAATGHDLMDFDVHVNIVGGGRIDGPSAGVAISLAIVSALQKRGIHQQVAVTGEISISGRVKAVGGIFEKAYGARQAGIKKVLIPAENIKDIPPDLHGMEIVPIESFAEAIPHVMKDVEIIPEVSQE
ncbi:MAG TPA: ATP-dependent protease, Lon family [Firmicutes bacterium]|jgi:ATP-dependent Lon protease|nr:ATP-dependent protease, Lon family [Bacillota bacterium]